MGDIASLQLQEKSKQRQAPPCQTLPVSPTIEEFEGSYIRSPVFQYTASEYQSEIETHEYIKDDAVSTPFVTRSKHKIKSSGFSRRRQLIVQRLSCFGVERPSGCRYAVRTVR